MKKTISLIIITVIILMTISIPAMASAEDELQFTLDEAVSMALRNSKSLEKAGLNTDMAAENRQDASLAWNPAWVSDYYPGTEAAYMALLSTDYAWETARKSEEMEKDIVRADTIKKYYNVLLAEEKLALQEKKVAVGQVRMDTAQMYKELGMFSLVEYQQSVVQFTGIQSEYMTAVNDLETAYLEFNQQLGISSEKRPILNDRPNYTELEIQNLDGKIRNITSESPSQWIADEGAELNDRLSNYPGSTDQNDLEAEKSVIEADKMREETALALYNMYYGIKGIESSCLNALESIKLAEESLKISEIRYELGMAVEPEVSDAQNALLQAENAVLALTCQHELLKIAFEKPWTAGALQ